MPTYDLDPASSHPQNRISHTVDEVTDSTKQFVSEHAMSTAMSVFGVGLGLGIAVGCAIAGGARRRRDENVAQRLGRRMLEVLGNAVPDSLSKIGQ